jgi:pimeloyl-ACP methyl ester carboxylesterase
MADSRMYGELVKFTTKDGLRLDGFLLRSRGHNKKVILNVFGMTSNFFSSDRYGVLYSAAKGGDVDIFLANNRGMGSISSFHTTGKESRFIGTAAERFEDCLLDIGGAAGFLSRMGYTEIFLQGHSTGCQKVAYYCLKRKNPKIKGIILLAPCDDYNLARQSLKGRFPIAVKTARNLIKKGMGDKLTPEWISHYTARRFLSYAELKNAEARLFNYDSDLKEFGQIKQPILTLFGSAEENLTKPLRKCMELLESKNGSRDFEWRILAGANHGFRGKEKDLAQIVLKWVNRIS